MTNERRTVEDLAKLSEGRMYTRQELRRYVTSEIGEVSENAFMKILERLMEEEKLFKVDRNRYTMVKPKALASYVPDYSRIARGLTETLKNKFPNLDFITSESILLNEFLDKPIVDNTLFVQVERTLNLDVYEYLARSYVGRVLYRPAFPEYCKEWEKDCIVVLDLVTQAPRFESQPHDIRIEKLLVDIVCDRTMAASFDAQETLSIYRKVFETDEVRRGMVMRYAARRGRKRVVQGYLEQLGIK